MPILVGIDEAGYGPLLGPLCVGIAVFGADSAPGADPPDLWSTLAAAVCRKPRDRRGRIAIADSKKLKRPNDSAGHPLEHLERGVLPCLAVARGVDAAWPADDLALLEALGASPSQVPPWSGDPSALPLANDPSLLRIAAAQLARALSEARVVLHAIRVAAIDAPAFNGALQRTRSKAAINTSAAFEHLLAVARRHPKDDLLVALDRHGGRVHYREELGFTFPGAAMRVLEESETRSAYELRHDGRRIQASWEVESESKHLPVALASMAAKLVRELWMARMNRFFARIMPELKPTAGYVEDGRRWLADVEPHLPRIGLDRAMLVRNA